MGWIVAAALVAASAPRLAFAQQVHSVTARGIEALDRKDYTTAMRLFQQGVREGDGAAMFDIGWMYRGGLGVKQDYAQAVSWFEKAGAQGNVPALNVLGQMYHDGDGVKQDYAAAMQWWLKAAAKGYIIADTKIAGMYQKGEGVPRDDAEVLKWWLKAAEEPDEAQAGVDDAQLKALKGLARFIVATAYERGLGTNKDVTQAIHWYRLAAVVGVSGARERLASLHAATEIKTNITLWCDSLDGFGRKHQALISIDTAARYMKMESQGSTVEYRDGFYGKAVTGGPFVTEAQKLHQIVIIDGDLIRFGHKDGGVTDLDTLDLRTRTLRVSGQPTPCSKASR